MTHPSFVLTAALVASAITTASPSHAASHPLPAEFKDHRVFLVAPAPDGKALRFYTDSGGGFNAIRADVAERLQLKTLAEDEGDEGKFRFVDYPAPLLAAGVPKPRDESAFHGGLVADDSGHLSDDGFLGNRWLDGRIWAFDYPAGTLAWLDSYQPTGDDHRVDLHFPAAGKDQPRIAFARIGFEVAGEHFDALLDTGAMATLGDSAAKEFGRHAGDAVATSFIIHSVFDRWHLAHPEWRVLDAADSIQGHAFRMIEVPEVDLGGVRIGPVWFTERPDPNFRSYMAKMMDQPTDGALGGSAFRYLRLVIDYPKSVAYVRRL